MPISIWSGQTVYLDAWSQMPSSFAQSSSIEIQAAKPKNTRSLTRRRHIVARVTCFSTVGEVAHLRLILLPASSSRYCRRDV